MSNRCEKSMDTIYKVANTFSHIYVDNISTSNKNKISLTVDRCFSGAGEFYDRKENHWPILMHRSFIYETLHLYQAPICQKYPRGILQSGFLSGALNLEGFILPSDKISCPFDRFKPSEKSR